MERRRHGLRLSGAASGVEQASSTRRASVPYSTRLRLLRTAASFSGSAGWRATLHRGLQSAIQTRRRASLTGPIMAACVPVVFSRPWVSAGVALFAKRHDLGRAVLDALPLWQQGPSPAGAIPAGTRTRLHIVATSNDKAPLLACVAAPSHAASRHCVLLRHPRWPMPHFAPSASQPCHRTPSLAGQLTPSPSYWWMVTWR